MQIKIDDIVVRRRIREDLGDLSPLVESIKQHGLMNPVVINSKKVLIAGERRLESAKLLGWKTIPVVVMDKNSEEERLEMEIEENTRRKPLEPDELVDAETRLERIKNPSFWQRLWRAVSGFFLRLFRRNKP